MLFQLELANEIDEIYKNAKLRCHFIGLREKVSNNRAIIKKIIEKLYWNLQEMWYR